MASGDQTGVNVRAIVVVLLGLAGAGGLAAVLMRDADRAPESAVVVETTASQDVDTTTEAPPDVASDEGAAPPPPTPPPPEPPRIDQIRVAPDGATVIAGRAPPDTAVSLRLDGEEVAATRSSGAGEFAAILTIAPSDEPRLLSIVATGADGTDLPGAETAIIAPFGMAVAEASAPDALLEVAEADTAPDAGSVGAPDPEPDTVEVAAAETGPEPSPEVETTQAPEPSVSGTTEAASDAVDAVDAGAGSEAQTEAASETPTQSPVSDEDTSGDSIAVAEQEGDAPRADGPDDALVPQDDPDVAERDVAGPSEADAAPAIVVAGSDGVRVVQGGGDAPSVQSEVRIDAITYTTEGEVAISGRGPADRQVRILLNNRPIQLGEIGPSGEWSLELPNVDPGTYTLTVTQLAPDGTVESRVDTPFLREDPARVARSPMRVEDGVSVITVQPGFTLWGIAEANFGDGIAYVQIFQENRDSIRDPDLIFPGQIFQLPDLPREASDE